MSCDVGEVMERLENELCYDYNYEPCSFSNLSFTSQLILQPFRRFTHVTAHSPTHPLLHLLHSSFVNPSFASPTSQALHLIHLANRPCVCFQPPTLNLFTNPVAVNIWKLCITLTSSTQADPIPYPFERQAVTCQKFVFYFAELPLFLSFVLSFLPEDLNVKRK